MSLPKQAICKNKINPTIHAIPVLENNIIWVWVAGKQAVVVDPAVTEPVKVWLKNRALNLVAILQTHHHSDHIGGTQGLINIWPSSSVIASGADFDRIPFQTISVQEGDKIELLGRKLEVLEVAGHTKAHIAYYLPNTKEEKINPVLFCGDTLFGGGCGRLFEGSPHQMFIALSRLCSLPAETNVYCAHEYTEENLRWAASLRPNDAAINKRLKEVITLRKKGELSLPSNINEERSTNLFVRAKSIEELAALRDHKDKWHA